ncbi:MAG: helix-turn-helix domain-containing protein [Chloroflexota bacterium]
MEEQNSTSPLVINNPDAAAFLLSAKTQQFLIPFMGQERSVSDAAGELGISMSALLYRVHQLLDYGLLKVVREEPRGGRAIKIYTSTATSFFVPFRVAQVDTIDDYLSSAKLYHEKLFTTNVVEVLQKLEDDWGMNVFVDEQGNVGTMGALHPGTVLQPDEVDVVILDFYCPLYLNEDEARAFQQEIAQTVEKYAHKRKGQQYLCHIGMVPVMKEPF